MSTTSSSTTSHVCLLCCKILAPRSDDPKIIKKAIEHHTKDAHTEKPLYWPTSGLPVVCENDCWSQGGCGRVIYDSYDFTNGEEIISGRSYSIDISIEEAEALGIKAMCDGCYWG